MLPDVGTSISVHEGIVDTSEQTILDETPKRIARRRRSIEEKRRIVEETLEAGASVARVARRHAVNANQVFYWRKKYREGRLGYCFRYGIEST
jgi:transposase